MAEEYDALPPSEFGRYEFAVDNRPHYDNYVEYRLHGVDKTTAFRKSFPRMYWDDYRKTPTYADEVEFNLYTVRRLAQRVSEIEPSQLWNPKIAMHEMLSVVRDPTAQTSAKVRAMESLNLLSGITFVDDKGKTRLGSSLDDFYRDQREQDQLREADQGTDSDDVPSAPTTETNEETTS
jgi:hypothetical protein